MAPGPRGFIAVLCVKAALSQSDVDSNVSLLQRSWSFDGAQSLKNHGKSNLPIVFVDLDAAPEIRWRNVTHYYTKLGVYPQALQKRREDFTFEDRSLLDVLHFEEEHLREFRGIVASFEGELADPEASFDHLKLSQTLSELGGWDEPVAGIAASLPSFTRQWFADQAKKDGCAGLLAAMPNGTVVHGRNMDYSGFEMEVNGRVLHYPDVTVGVTFLRAGKPIITSLQWPLATGFNTAMRYGGWSFENNIRPHGKDRSYLSAIVHGSQGFKLKVRKLMETVSDFETAVTKLYEMNVMAPMYFIVAGSKAYEGAVITLDRGGVHSPSSPPVMRLSRDTPVLRNSQNYTGSWHIIQTNDDLNGLALDERRPTEEARLLESTQDMVSPDWAFSQLLEPPLYGEQTVYTSVFIPSTNYFRTMVHFGSTR